MTDVTWLAAHSERPFEPARIQAWIAGAEAAFHVRLGGLERAERVGRHLAVIAWFDAEQAPNGWLQVESDANHLSLFDGFPIGFERLGLEAASPLAIAATIGADPSAIERLHPPFASVSLDDDRLTLAIDPLGFATAYRAEARELTAWSSSPGLASLFAYGAVRPSDEGWVGMLAHSRFSGDASQLAGVRRESPRAVATASDRPDGLSVHRPDPIEPLFAAGAGRDLAIAVRAAIERVYQSIRRLDPGPITIPFSGGRDSRVLSSIGLATGTVDAFWTSAPPEMDIKIVRGLLDRLDRAISWTTVDKSESLRSREAELVADGLDGFWERALRHHNVTEGHGDVSPHAGPQRPRPPREEVKLWGIGGEFARAFYYHADALDDREGRTAAFWQGQGRGTRLVDAEARAQLLTPRIDAIRRSYRDRGVNGLHQLDLFYLLERIRRLKGRTTATGGIWPYFTYDYVRAGLPADPVDRVHSRYYEDVVRDAVPAWAGQPYSHELKAANFEESTAASQAEAYWDSRLTALVAAEALSLTRGDRLVVHSELEDLVRAGGRADRRAVQRMRTLNQVLNYVTYRNHLDRVQSDFATAGGVGVLEPAPDVPTTGQLSGRSRPARSTGSDLPPILRDGLKILGGIRRRIRGR